MPFTGKSISTLLVISTISFTFLGCATTKPGPYVPASGATSKEDVYAAVLLDEGLQKWIAVDRIKTEHLEDRRLKVHANIRNMQGQAITVQAQTIYKDNDGFSIGDDTAWQTLIFSPNETKTYESVSMKTSAVRYTIRIRYGQ